MNLRQLEYFTACAEQLNFTRAAEQCYISQTAMTQQIRALETSIGAVLFLRDKHHVELTAAGELFYGEAKAILRRTESALRLVQHVDALEEGKISVGFIRGYGHSDLAKTLHSFHQTHPGVHIELVRDNEHGLLSLFEQGELDIVFTVTPYARKPEQVKRMLLKHYPMMVVMAGNHALAEKPYLTYRELENENFLIMQPAGRQRAETEEAIFIHERGGFVPKVTAMESEPETLLLQVAMGLGISILPEYVIHHAYSREDIRIVPLVKDDQTAETLDFEVLWYEGENQILRQLIDIIESVTYK
ncbi:MAG: LysR family transcriptional regulator [Eubacteriales bacterium]|nr:LysR family transcriptional regulator [Eubacteriales bacterium]